MEELLREVLSGSRMLHFEGTKKDEAPLVEAAGRDAGYVEDEGALYEKMTVRKYLKFFAGLSGTEKRVRSAVEQMHLSELLGKRLSSCTEGQKKRVRIAREIVRGAEDYFILNPIAFEEEESKKVILGWMESFCEREGRLITLSWSHRDTCICPGDHYEIARDGVRCIDQGESTQDSPELPQVSKISVSYNEKILMVLTPAILALIFRVVYFDPWMLLLTMALFNIVLVPLTDYPLLLVEEKERDTLSLLSRSGVSLAHFALSKAGACLVVGELMAVVVFLIAGADMSLLPEYLLVHLAGVTALLPWGFLTGVYAKDQNSVNVYAAVSVVAVYVAPVFSYWNVAFGRLAEFLPTGILGVVLKKLQPMEGFMDVSLVWGGAVCAVWFLAGIASLFVIRKKRPFFPTLEAGTRQR